MVIYGDTLIAENRDLCTGTPAPPPSTTSGGGVHGVRISMPSYVKEGALRGEHIPTVAYVPLPRTKPSAAASNWNGSTARKRGHAAHVPIAKGGTLDGLCNGDPGYGCWVFKVAGCLKGALASSSS